MWVGTSIIAAQANGLSGSPGRARVLDAPTRDTLRGSPRSTQVLSALPEVRWSIVEQPRHVETGRVWFEDDRLRFYANIGECLSETQPNIVLLSGVLQYLERPYAVLDQVVALPCEHVIIDRTPFWSGSSDRLCVQTVPPSIYPAGYPSWIFSRQRFQERLQEEWQTVVRFDDSDELAAPAPVVYQGAVLVRRSQLS